jgi:hypothetical protein
MGSATLNKIKLKNKEQKNKIKQKIYSTVINPTEGSEKLDKRISEKTSIIYI